MTTGARHLAQPPLVPLLPEPLLFTTFALTNDDDVEDGEGTEVMLVFGMPGMFMCVGMPLLTTLLALGEISRGREFILRARKFIVRCKTVST